MKNKTTKIFICTDTHFGHNMLIDKNLRPKDFELRIATKLWDIHKDDLLIYLGDVCLGKDEEQHDKYISKIKCKKILVKGNHDHKSNTWYLNHGWDFVCKEFIDRYYGKNILFSHEAKWQRDNIDYNIHGHSHGNAHRDEEHCNFYDPEYHKEIALEKTNYQIVNLETFIKKI